MAHSLGTQGNEFPMPACVVSREDGVSSALIWCTLKTVSQLEKKKKKSVAFFLRMNSNIQAFFPPANFRSPAILWEENGVKIKHSIQK